MSDRVHQIAVVLQTANGCQIVVPQQAIGLATEADSAALAKQEAVELTDRLGELLRGTVVHLTESGMVRSTGLTALEVLQSLGITKVEVALAAVAVRTTALVVPEGPRILA